MSRINFVLLNILINYALQLVCMHYNKLNRNFVFGSISIYDTNVRAVVIVVVDCGNTA